jgi:mono/diheme cytochrome c family protein
MPRNEYELIAQGYLLGNCSHCHNPNGYASVTFPILTDVLSFLPKLGAFGGVFQFPLAQMSPRIVRGQLQSVQLPYITPSLQDYPSYPSTDEDPIYGDRSNAYTERFFLPKWQERSEYDGFIYAPWRSLVYRNTDNPFPYADDFTIYPHMPMNSPGFDCRAKQILGDWMVSIPAVRKRTDLPEYSWPFDDFSEISDNAPNPAAGQPPDSRTADMSFQPYVEVTPGDPAYPRAITDAEARLAIFHSGYRPGGSGAGPMGGADQQWFGSRFYACADTSDTVDPTVTGCISYPTEKESPLINVPTHPNWVKLDLTQSTDAWSIRDQSWQPDVVLHSPVPQPPDLCSSVTALASANSQRQVVSDLLAGISVVDAGADPGSALSPVSLTQGVSWNDGGNSDDGGIWDSKISNVRGLFDEAYPVGLWTEKPECDWSKVPQVTTVEQERAKQPHFEWLDRSGLDPKAHVYKETMGAVVFNEVCINCHGANADSHGRLADNLANISGGHTIVADFKDGLFGPKTNPGANRSALFGDPDASLNSLSDGGDDGGDGAALQMLWDHAWRAPLDDILTQGDAAVLQQWVDDWGARYMGYMALGGTKATINPSFLGIVAHTPFLGEARTGVEIKTSEGANMLAIGRELCGALLTVAAIPYAGGKPIPFASNSSGALLFDNGDAEIWLRLCTLNNPPPVIAYLTDGHHFPQVTSGQSTSPFVLSRAAFGPDAGVGNGNVVGDENGNVHPALTTANLHPWCVTSLSSVPDCLNQGETPCTAHTPICPLPVFDPANSDWVTLDSDLVTQWKLRGAINAGLAVFVYLDDLTRSKAPAQATFDQCDQFIAAATGADAGP